MGFRLYCIKRIPVIIITQACYFLLTSIFYETENGSQQLVLIFASKAQGEVDHTFIDNNKFNHVINFPEKMKCRALTLYVILGIQSVALLGQLGTDPKCLGKVKFQISILLQIYLDVPCDSYPPITPINTNDFILEFKQFV